jgi:hypothetical protein
MDISVKQKVEDYVKKNYKSYVNKTLIITEGTNCFYVKRNETESPLILGKVIVE